MRRLVAAFLVALFLLVCSAASAQRTGGSFGMRSWGSGSSFGRSASFSRPSTPYRSATFSRPTLTVSRPAVNRVGTYRTTQIDRHVAWWPNLHEDRHDHHVIVVGSGDRDRPTDEGTEAAFCAVLIACLLAYAWIKF